jgi:hypothetical protein
VIRGDGVLEGNRACGREEGVLEEGHVDEKMVEKGISAGPSACDGAFWNK